MGARKSEEIKQKDVSNNQYEKKFKKIRHLIDDIQKLTEYIEEINKVADDIKISTSTKTAKISSILNVYKTRINSSIELILKEYEEADLE